MNRVALRYKNHIVKLNKRPPIPSWRPLSQGGRVNNDDKDKGFRVIPREVREPV